MNDRAEPIDKHDEFLEAVKTLVRKAFMEGFESTWTEDADSAWNQSDIKNNVELM